MSHVATINVRFYELDPYNHVNHSVYVQYCEVARVEWLTDVGFPSKGSRPMGCRSW